MDRFSSQMIESGKSLIKIPRIAAKSASPSGGFQQPFLTLKRQVTLLKRCQPVFLSSTIRPSGLLVKHYFLEHTYPSGHQLSTSSLEFPDRRTPALGLPSWPLPGPSIFPGRTAGTSHILSYHLECLCRNLQSIGRMLPSQSAWTAVWLRVRSPRRTIFSQGAARRLADSASIGACRRPT